MKFVTRADIIRSAREWLGTPYIHQASVKQVGCDCLGLVRGVWRALYQKEPERPPNYTPDWAEALESETLKEAAARWMVEVDVVRVRPGDVLLFRWRATLPAKHIAILSSTSTFIHASDRLPVSEVSLSPWWRRRTAYAFQFPNLIED